jgi:glucose-6-phosphate 1-epimerase
LNASDLNSFALGHALRFEDAAGGLTRAVIATDLADAELYLHGAHLTRWTPRGQRPVLYISGRSFFEADKAIRGGVPICFPWFGPRGGGLPGPIHGVARLMEWKLAATRLREDGCVQLDLTLAPEGAGELIFRVVIGSHLEMELVVGNPAGSQLNFEAALHTYFGVGDIQRVSITGLEGTAYIDKTDGFRRKQQPNEPIRIAKETDQVHLATTAACAIEDPAWNRRITVEKTGSRTTVVWNPWIDKTKTLTDMAPDDWQEMLCVETANAGENAVRLASGESHRMSATVRVESMPER